MIDTASSHSKNQPSVNNSNNFDGVTPKRQQSGVRSSVPAQQQRSGDDSQVNKSRMGDDGLATPRNLIEKNQPGSGTLPEAKRSMDGVMPTVGGKSAESKELMHHVQSATHSQQFKTMDNSKTQLHDDAAQDMTLKNKLQTS